MRKLPRIHFKRFRERKSRISLTLVLAGFVFAILLAAICITWLGVWAMSKAGVFLDVEGRQNLLSMLLYMSASSLVLGLVGAFLGSRIPLRPVNMLINKMNRLAAGDFQTRLTFSDALMSYPPTKEISESFNTLAEELENTELLRSDFINSVSHEFKTPIVSITGFAELLEEGELTEEQRALYVRSIREESMRLSAMATNILNLTKIEKQTILTDITEFNLSEQLRSVILLLENKWTKKELELELCFEEHRIEANEEQLRQVWINLFDNAVKFTPHGGKVTLRVNEEEELLCVELRNTGSEIPPDKQKKIFTKFYQADESHATHGNGIGLAIVKHIVELHGGEIDVQSEQNETAFFVTLPKAQA